MTFLRAEWEKLRTAMFPSRPEIVGRSATDFNRSAGVRTILPSFGVCVGFVLARGRVKGRREDLKIELVGVKFHRRISK